MTTVVAARTPSAGHFSFCARITPAHTAIALTIARNRSLSTSPGVPENAATRRDGHDQAAVRASARTVGCVAAVVLTTLLCRQAVQKRLGRPCGRPSRQRISLADLGRDVALRGGEGRPGRRGAGA